MNMDEVNRIIEEHNKKLDSMTPEERKKYYAKYGIKINDENTKKKGIAKKYTIQIILYLKAGETMEHTEVKRNKPRKYN